MKKVWIVFRLPLTLQLKREDGGVDAAFSMEKDEFAAMVCQIRRIEKALGTATYDLNQKQEASRHLQISPPLPIISIRKM
ncbi:hypothetical protein E5329_00255 [Petralouisia muris]|uniref:Uncharacterized protein n=1 Tax=Petralouisia muris TaxID=3032872 RepID=A0AC61S1T9_9FIRM|nr:hypothetical protein E5329_00255 [Petralouisia muris]